MVVLVNMFQESSNLEVSLSVFMERASDLVVRILLHAPTPRCVKLSVMFHYKRNDLFVYNLTNVIPRR